jgi:hypothetical protein
MGVLRRVGDTPVRFVAHRSNEFPLHGVADGATRLVDMGAAGHAAVGDVLPELPKAGGDLLDCVAEEIVLPDARRVDVDRLSRGSSDDYLPCEGGGVATSAVPLGDFTGAEVESRDKVVDDR